MNTVRKRVGFKILLELMEMSFVLSGSKRSIQTFVLDHITLQTHFIMVYSTC